MENMRHGKTQGWEWMPSVRGLSWSPSKAHLGCSPAVRHALGCVVPQEFLSVPSTKCMLRAPTPASLLILPLPWLNETTFLCKLHSLCEASMLGKGSWEGRAVTTQGSKHKVIPQVLLSTMAGRSDRPAFWGVSVGTGSQIHNVPRPSISAPPPPKGPQTSPRTIYFSSALGKLATDLLSTQRTTHSQFTLRPPLARDTPSLAKAPFSAQEPGDLISLLPANPPPSTGRGHCPTTPGQEPPCPGPLAPLFHRPSGRLREGCGITPFPL